MDIFAPDWYDPIRIELFGDQIESIRRFEVSSQRSLEVLPAIDVTALEILDEDRSHLGDYLPPAVGSCSSSRASWKKRGGTI